MFLDFGVDPRVMDDLSLDQMSDLMSSLSARRGGKVPTRGEEIAAMNQFRDIVKDDKSVKLDMETASGNS